MMCQGSHRKQAIQAWYLAKMFMAWEIGDNIAQLHLDLTYN